MQTLDRRIFLSPPLLLKRAMKANSLPDTGVLNLYDIGKSIVCWWAA